MVSDEELVNGLPPAEPHHEGGVRWPLRPRKRGKASRRALAEKAEGPLPGTTEERDG
jgi:hypothetical protein